MVILPFSLRNFPLIWAYILGSDRASRLQVPAQGFGSLRFNGLELESVFDIAMGFQLYCSKSFPPFHAFLGVCRLTFAHNGCLPTP